MGISAGTGVASLIGGGVAGAAIGDGLGMKVEEEGTAKVGVEVVDAVKTAASKPAALTLPSEVKKMLAVVLGTTSVLSTEDPDTS